MLSWPAIECRSGDAAAYLHVGGARRTLAGYAVLFNVLSAARVRVPEGDGSCSWMYETIRPGAFRAFLASGRTVLAVLDHERRRFLGNTFDRSLRLREDTRGLAYELHLPPDARGDEVVAMQRRGQLTGVSIGFVPRDEDHELRAGRWVRIVKRADLRHVSPVTAPRIPAYPGTTLREVSGSTDRRSRLAVLAWEMGLATEPAWDDPRVRLYAAESELSRPTDDVRRARLEALEREVGLRA